jgi:hypothetical protein
MAKLAQRALSAPVWYSDDGCYFVLISGQPVFVIAGSLSIQKAIGRRSTASFAVKTDAPTYFPEDSQVSIYDGKTTLVFAGYLVAPQYNKPGFQKVLFHQLQACDKHRLADKRAVVGSWVGYTGAWIFRYLITNYLAAEGVTIGQIYDDNTISDTRLCGDTTLCGEAIGVISAIAFDYCFASEAADQIVKSISASGIPFYWQIDQNSAAWLVPYDAIPNSKVIDGTQVDEVFNAFTVTRTNPSYRNNQIIKGGTAETVTQNEVRMGDGNTKSWPMRYAVSQAPTVTVNSTAKTIGIRGVDTGKDFYWSKGEFEVSTDNTYTGSDTIAISYIGMYKNVTIVSNSAQIALEAAIDGSSGQVDAVEDIALTSLDSQLQIAGARLTRYAVQSPPEFEFSTLDSSYAPGQFVEVSIPDLSLTQNMLVESETLDDSTDGFNIWHRLHLIAGPNDTTWTAFWGEITGSGNISSSADSATATIVTVSQSFSVPVSVSISFSPTTFACPLCSNSTLCSDSTIIC